MSELNANELYVDEEPLQSHDLIVEDDVLPVSHVVIVEEEPKQMPEIGEYVPGSNTLLVSEEEKEEEQEAKDTDWEHDQDHSKFLPHFDSKIKNIPRHSGQTVLGCERAIAFLKSLLTELSKALRGDLEGKIDEQAAEDRYKDTQNMIERLEHQIKKLKGTGKTAELDVNLISEGHCSTCNSVAPMWHDVIDEKVVCLRCDAGKDQDQLEKVAYSPKINVYISPFERAIVGILVNSSVSAGRNIEEVYEKLKNKYNFSAREELAIQQLTADYGYPIFKDRARLNENSDPSDGNGIDFATNYYA